MSQTEVQLIKDNAVVEADIANDAVTRDKINVVSTSSAPGIEIKGDGGSQEGYLQLNCRVNSHGVKIQSPPHSASQSYKIILPDNQIAADKFLKVKSITGSGSTATGQLEFSDISAGITYANLYRLTTSFQHTGTHTDLTNWEQADDASSGKIGTWSNPSSGVFTFPATGIYDVHAESMMYMGGGINSPWAGLEILVTTDGGSNYDLVSNGYTSQSDDLNATRYHNQGCDALVDVTDTSNVKLKIRAVRDTNYGDVYFAGSSNHNNTYVKFVRLGDT